MPATGTARWVRGPSLRGAGGRRGTERAHARGNLHAPLHVPPPAPATPKLLTRKTESPPGPQTAQTRCPVHSIPRRRTAAGACTLLSSTDSSQLVLGTKTHRRSLAPQKVPCLDGRLGTAWRTARSQRKRDAWERCELKTHDVMEEVSHPGQSQGSANKYHRRDKYTPQPTQRGGAFCFTLQQRKRRKWDKGS